MSLLLYLAGSALLAFLLNAWRGGRPWRRSAAYCALAGAFFAVPLVTTSHIRVPTDLVYRTWPFVEEVGAPPLPSNALLSDVPLQFLPFRQLVRDRLFHLHAPLWSNEMGSGQPLLGNAQSAPFSPLGLIALPLPPVRALPLVAALQTFLALLLMDALARELGATSSGAAFASIAFAFSAYSTSWALHPHATTVAWAPGVLLGLVALRRQQPRSLAGLVGCATGMALSGHVETVAHCALVAAIVAAALLLAPGGRLRFASSLLRASLLTAGLAAPVLLPVWEGVPESARAAMLRESPDWSQPPAFELATTRVLLDPMAYGDPRDDNWTGPWNWCELCTGYAGLLTLALALAAAVSLRGRIAWILLGGLVALAAAFACPPFQAIVRSVPLLHDAANGRLRFVWVLAIALGAGLGLERLVTSRLASGIAAAACALAAGALALIPAHEPSPWQDAWWLATIAGAAATAAGFALLARERRSMRIAAWLPWLATAMLALDLGLLSARFVPVLPSRFDLTPPPILQVLQAERRAHPREPFRILSGGTNLAPNLAAFYGLWDARSDDPMQPARAATVIGHALQPTFRVGERVYLLHRGYPVPMLSYLAVRYVLTGHRATLAAPWALVWEGAGGRLWKNPRALSTFFMPASWSTAPSESAELAATLTNGDFAERAVAAVATASAGVQRQSGTIAVEQVDDNAFELTAQSATGGLVASSVSWTSGWRARIDGAPAPVVRANYGFLGVLVPPGEHRVTLEYRPLGWSIGLVLLASTLVYLLLFVALPAARRRGPVTEGA